MSKIIKDDDYCVCCGEYCGTSTQICAKCKKGLDKKEFVPGKGYKDLVDNVATAEYAIDAIKQVEEQEICINEIMIYIRLSGRSVVCDGIEAIINRYKAT